eukprot:s3468_g8.t1
MAPSNIPCFARTAISFNTALGASLDARFSLRLFQEMTEVEVQPDVVSFNAALNACAATGEEEAARCFLEEMNDRRIAPNLVTCNTNLKLFATLQDGQSALAMLEEMPSHRLQPDLITFNTAIEAVSEVNDLENLWNTLKDQPGLQPDAITYKSAAFRFAQASSWNRVLDLVSEIPASLEVTADEAVYQDALTALAKVHQDAPAACALGLLNEMQSKRLRVDEDAYSLTIASMLD